MPDAEHGDMTADAGAERVDLSRREVFQGALLGAALLGTGLVSACATTTSAAGISKAEALYQGHPNEGQRCGGCVHYQFPVGCALVDGLISIHGWCRLYTAKA